MSKSRPGPEFHKEPIPCLKPLVAGHRTMTRTVRLKPRPRFLVVPHSSSLPKHLIGLSSIIQVMHNHLTNLTEGLSLVPWHQLQGCHFNQHRHHHDLSDHNSYMMLDLLRITLWRQQKERKDRTTSFLIWVIPRIHHHQGPHRIPLRRTSKIRIGYFLLLTSRPIVPSRHLWPPDVQVEM